jgi:translocation protein SEC62
MMGYEFWFLPNLFDEQLGFCESFIPVYSVEPTKEGQLMYRIGVFVAFFSFCYWAVTQPSEFDGFVKGQGDFIKDLYAGTLLSDMSQKDKEGIDKPKMPTLADLLKKLDSEDEEEKELSEEEAAEALLNSLMEKELDDETEHDEE